MDFNDFPQFPHCDARVLHAPGECIYCDKHPDWQKLRVAWGINFTGHNETKNEWGSPMLPCPSEVARPLSTINKWDGNVPMKDDRQINTEAPMFEGKTVEHDSFSRHVHVTPEEKPKPVYEDSLESKMDVLAGKLIHFLHEFERLRFEHRGNKKK